MGLSDTQWEFVKDLALLILFAESQGFKLTQGEAKRTRYQQARYVSTGKSQTFNSDHLVSLAQDFNVFFDVDGDGDKDYTGGLSNAKEVCQVLGDYWCSLHPKNYWGGNFTKGWDTPHFGRKR